MKRLEAISKPPSDGYNVLILNGLNRVLKPAPVHSHRPEARREYASVPALHPVLDC